MEELVVIEMKCYASAIKSVLTTLLWTKVKPLAHWYGYISINYVVYC